MLTHSVPLRVDLGQYARVAKGSFDAFYRVGNALLPQLVPAISAMLEAKLSILEAVCASRLLTPSNSDLGCFVWVFGLLG